jgi:erythromycin esterase
MFSNKLMLPKMKEIIVHFVIFLLLISLISCQRANNNGSTELTEYQIKLIQELNQMLIPLNIPVLDLTDTELNFLDQLGNARIVGLGEATHGTCQFFQMKHRIFQYLVKHFKHRAFGFEADFGESIFFDNYICNGEGNLEELMKEKMHFWTWRTHEVKQLLKWMREYNTGRKEENKIHYYGFDCQFMTYQPDWIQEYLSPIEQDFWVSMESLLEQIQEWATSYYENMSEETYNDILSQLESFQKQFGNKKDILIQNSSQREYEINKQMLNTFMQCFILKYKRAKKDYSPDLRDKFMAENALWIADFLGENTKITLWAANGHVRKDNYPEYGPMGYYLREELGHYQYKVVGFAFSKGEFTALEQSQSGGYGGLKTHEITEEPLNSSINFLFYNASHPNFAFHLDTIPNNSELNYWISTLRPILSIGSLFNGNPNNYYVYRYIKKNYNWIIYFDQTTASQLL